MDKSKKCCELTFYRCNVCGNLIVKLNDSGITPVCCARDMEILTPNTTDGAEEKHVPMWMMDGCKVIVTVSTEEHPMSEEHYIQLIALETNRGFSVKYLCPGDNPEACFKLCKGEVVKNIYEFCNIHKLWKADMTSEESENERPVCGI